MCCAVAFARGLRRACWPCCSRDRPPEDLPLDVACAWAKQQEELSYALPTHAHSALFTRTQQKLHRTRWSSTPAWRPTLRSCREPETSRAGRAPRRRPRARRSARRRRATPPSTRAGTQQQERASRKHARFFCILPRIHQLRAQGTPPRAPRSRPLPRKEVERVPHPPATVSLEAHPRATGLPGPLLRPPPGSGQLQTLRST